MTKVKNRVMAIAVCISALGVLLLLIGMILESNIAIHFGFSALVISVVIMLFNLAYMMWDGM